MTRYILLFLSLLVPNGVVQAQRGDQLVEVLQQLTRLESEVRKLRGEVERLSYENKRLKSQQNNLYVDVDHRLRAIEGGASANRPVIGGVTSHTGTGQTSPIVGRTPQSAIAAPSPGLSGSSGAGLSPSPVVPPVSGSGASTVAVDPAREQADYKAAFNLLKLGKYDEAVLAYSEFLRKYPTGKYASNAQYWLGEANYVTRQFSVAIQEFKNVINRYPQARKVPDAMLKIGYIHYELKQFSDARNVLTELTKQFPGTTAARLAGNRLQRMKLEGY